MQHTSSQRKHNSPLHVPLQVREQVMLRLPVQQPCSLVTGHKEVVVPEGEVALLSVHSSRVVVVAAQSRGVLAAGAQHSLGQSVVRDAAGVGAVEHLCEMRAVRASADRSVAAVVRASAGEVVASGASLLLRLAVAAGCCGASNSGDWCTELAAVLSIVNSVT
jgi:hypothetical protein